MVGFIFIDLIGTASMLPRNQNGVVNNELKVYGIKNLRIVSQLYLLY